MALPLALFAAGTALRSYGIYSQAKVQKKAAALEAQQLEEIARSNFATGTLKVRQTDREQQQLDAQLTTNALSTGLAGNQLDWLRSQLKEDTSAAKLAELFSTRTESANSIKAAAMRRFTGRNAMRQAGLNILSTGVDAYGDWKYGD